jgi:hypothetical protein
MIGVTSTISIKITNPKLFDYQQVKGRNFNMTCRNSSMSFKKRLSPNSRVMNTVPEDGFLKRNCRRFRKYLLKLNR